MILLGKVRGREILSYGTKTRSALWGEQNYYSSKLGSEFEMNIHLNSLVMMEQSRLSVFHGHPRIQRGIVVAVTQRARGEKEDKLSLGERSPSGITDTLV